MNKKPRFILTEESKIAVDGKTKLYRLKVNTEFTHKFLGKIKAGTLGGWVESLKLKDGATRISGNAWVSDNAIISDNARISDDAWIYGDAWISGNARISDDARISGRFNINTDIDFELPRINIDTKKKMIKLKRFLDNF